MAIQTLPEMYHTSTQTKHKSRKKPRRLDGFESDINHRSSMNNGTDPMVPNSYLNRNNSVELDPKNGKNV